MNWTIGLDLLPYLISLSISTGIGVYAWRRRAESGAAAYAIVALSQASWTLGYIFELLQPDLDGKIFWDNTQFIGGVGWLVGFVAFTLQFNGQRVSRPRLMYGVLSLPGIAIVLLAFTNPLHGLIRSHSWLVADPPFSALLYDFTPVTWAWGIYVYGLFAICIVMLIVKYVRTHHLYRTQVGLVIVGNAIPASGTLLTLAGIVANPLRDVSPFTFAVGNLIVVWGLFQYRLFDVMPIARDTLIENMTDAVYVLDIKRRVVDLNGAARRMIGRFDPGVIGQPADQVFAAWPDLVARYRDILVQERAEVEVDSVEGRRQLELAVQPLRNGRNRLVGQLAMARDITARKQIEAELQRRTDQLEVANEQLQILGRIKDEFVSNVSHELSTPITNLKLYLRLLALRPDKQDIYVATLERETQRLANLIEGLLILSRLDQNRQTLNLQAVDLTSLVMEYITDRRALAESKGLTLVCEPGLDLPTVRADPVLLGQTISILLTNALNYTPAGGSVTVTTQTAAYDNQQWAGFGVTDTGVGIPPGEQDQLFTRFFRGSAGRELGVPGTGLGLAIVKEIVERHSGRTEVQSEGVIGKGATISIWLPVT